MTTKENILTACKNLANCLTREELKNFICNEDYRFNEERAEAFLKWLENLEASRDQFLMFKIRVALICSWLFYSFDFKKDIRSDLEHYKALEQERTEEEAKKRLEEQEKTKFKENLIKFYKWEITEDQIEEIFNPIHRNFYTDYRATVKKIKNKLNTKSHSLEKVLKVIDEDIERWYHRSIQTGETVWKEYRSIANSHWFWY